MTTKGPSKPILKKRTPKAPSDEQKAKAERDKRNMDLALSHARRIELRKQIETQILANIETLMELPSVNPPSTQADARSFTTLIRPFQPSDFASLVEERRINGSCGYALCPCPPRSETLGPSASWKLKGKGAEDFCSTACVRKALYVKAQLSQVPAWERVVGEQGEVVLPPDDGEVKGDGVMERVRAAREEGKVGVANRSELAAERGEEVTSFKPRQVMMESVVEKPRKHGAGAPEFPTVSREASYGAIEGYEPKYSSVERQDEDESEDADPGVQNAQAVSVSSDVRSEGELEEDAFDEEEEAAWRELQAGLHHLNTGHDR